ncbi:MAG: hypothetical protein KG029_16710, partial [Bacteroidetes bacterium]|nr:hypothetical protein [Bacteroidota bacterium]
FFVIICASFVALCVIAMAQRSTELLKEIMDSDSTKRTSAHQNKIYSHLTSSKNSNTYSPLNSISCLNYLATAEG